MSTVVRHAGAAIAAGLVLFLAGCERPPVESTQTGYRGTAMVQVVNPRIAEAQADRHRAPEPIPPIPGGGPTAGQVYQNVQVLQDLSVGEFTRLMLAITAWVSPAQGCNYCHQGENFAADTLYTKVVARRMIQMTQHINTDWKSHVAQTGVTCYTCHRGEPVPAEVWFTAAPSPQDARAVGARGGQNIAAASVGQSSLPYDPYTPFLSRSPQEIRVASTTALPVAGTPSTQQTEKTYGLMMHMSSSLGVNCTYCHNSQNFGSWELSSPPRLTAWHGIRMARDLNEAYLEPLTPVFPRQRLGELGDVAKINCATCHQGANKPLKGAPLLKDHPELAAMPARTGALSGEDLAALARLMPAGSGMPGVLAR